MPIIFISAKCVRIILYSRTVQYFSEIQSRDNSAIKNKHKLHSRYKAESVPSNLRTGSDCQKFYNERAK